MGGTGFILLRVELSKMLFGFLESKEFFFKMSAHGNGAS
jgi:hypothetical protein